MVNDRTWMINRGASDRTQPKYIEGVETFLAFAFKDKDEAAELRCPCMHCLLAFCIDQDTMWTHLMEFGIVNDYNPWEFHGEDPIQSPDDEGSSGDDEGSSGDDLDIDDDMMRDDMVPLIHEALNVRFPSSVEGNNSNTGAAVGIDDVPENFEMPGNSEMPENFERLMRSAEESLYPGCKTFSKLEFMVTLLHIKVSYKWSNKSFSMLLKALHRAFGFDGTFPKSSYEAKKYTRDLGLNYVKIDACINHCVLFRKEYESCTVCPTCGCSRWEDAADEQEDSGSEGEELGKGSRIPRLVLRHFPLIPRLQRIYRTSTLAEHMRWHKQNNRVNDGILRHPSDSEAWKFIDECFPRFASEPRNVRLALASDGFIPGPQFGRNYSIWPVFLVPYNLPPWMCMKRSNMMLSLLIPGSKSPGNDIDVFLQPLIDELKELWEVGVKTYDAYSQSTFNMHAVLMWTISDFPAYANLSGWSTKGALACPNCHKDTTSVWLWNCHKYCYMGSRRFLPLDHKWRLDEEQFGSVEERPPPRLLKGDEIVEDLSVCHTVAFGKQKSKKRKRDDRYLVPQWKKLSIFFQLPYWKYLKIRHNLDVMHIEKNVCDSILGTLLDIPGKNKDSLKARLDLEVLKMHDELQVVKIGDKYQVPKAPYNLTLSERRQVTKLLSMLTLPDGYSSNIARCANSEDGRVSGMKSHDCHVFMQDLLVPAFRGVLDDTVLEPLAEISMYFKQLCSKTLSVNLLEQMGKNIVITLCKLERIFIPSFFVVMVHLMIHLAAEAQLAGPVHYRWMYRFEREMHTLKSYVGNKARPEGSIAEAYIADECLTFCSRYLTQTETQFNRMQRNDDPVVSGAFSLSVFSKVGKPLGKASYNQFGFDEWRQAQSYVLKNCPEVDPFLQEYENIEEKSIDFISWFERRMNQLQLQGDRSLSEELLCLAQGPMKSVTTYHGYVVNGYRFHTRRRQKRRKTQNSGVVVKGEADSDCRDFYGVLKEVVVLEYGPVLDNRIPKIVLFRCKWFDVYNDGRGIKEDKFGNVLLNTSRRLQTDEPFSLASQACQG